MIDRLLLYIFLFLLSTTASGQQYRGQYPPYLANSFFGVNAGYINYRFNQAQLEPGFAAESVHIPHAAIRVILFGHQFNDHLAAQISYMRPVGWVEYRNVNGSNAAHEVGINMAGLTLTSSLPIAKRWTIKSEAGWGLITRGGFVINNDVVVKDASYSTILAGAGLGYSLNRNWELHTNATWSPRDGRTNQPSTLFISAGFNYTMRTLAAKTIERKKSTGYIFPKHILQFGFSTNGAGYGVNTLFSKKLPVFWGGDVRVSRGFNLQYQRNIFHARKVFSLDVGATLGHWQTDARGQRFWSAALFPLLRFTFLRSTSADVYLNYSLAGPAYLSKTKLDDHDTGRHFTFQDFMGLGLFLGKKRNLNLEARIAHFSNGNIFPKNDGVMVPLTFAIGYCFDSQRK